MFNELVPNNSDANTLIKTYAIQKIMGQNRKAKAGQGSYKLTGGFGHWDINLDFHLLPRRKIGLTRLQLNVPPTPWHIQTILVVG
jgi:hypothetical protein